MYPHFSLVCCFHGRWKPHGLASRVSCKPAIIIAGTDPLVLGWFKLRSAVGDKGQDSLDCPTDLHRGLPDWCVHPNWIYKLSFPLRCDSLVNRSSCFGSYKAALSDYQAGQLLKPGDFTF